MYLSRCLTYRAILLSALAFAAAMTFFELTDIDLRLQDRMFDQETKRWVVNSSYAPLCAVLYSGPKVVLTSFAVLLAAMTGVELHRERRWTWDARCYTYVIVCMVLVPVAAASIKPVFDVHCPHMVSRYGGKYAYKKLLQARPPNEADHRGTCFPAGHASGGFALMALGFVARSRSRAAMGYAAGLVAGWAMGIYQMLKGAHFLSHTVFTMFLALLICQALARVLLRDAPRR